MKTLFRLLLGCLVLGSIACNAQDIRSRMEQMKTAYTASGSIVVLDGQTLVIEPNMPAPVCALPREEDGKIAWYRYAFPSPPSPFHLQTWTSPSMGEDRVFTNPEAPVPTSPATKATP